MFESKKNQLQLPVEDRRKFKPQNFVHTSLFSEVYIFNDLPMQFKNLWDRIDDHGRYDEFFSNLVTLMSSFSSEEANKWNHTETLNNLIYPMLEILGYGNYFSTHHAYLDNHHLSLISPEGGALEIRPSILICEDEMGRNYIKKSNKENVVLEIKKYLKMPVITNYFGASFDRKASKYDLKKDEIGKRGDVFSNLSSNEHVGEYLNILGTTWGLYSDGAVWRLYRKDAMSSDSEKYFEFDFLELYHLFRTSGHLASEEHSEFFEIAKYFFWFFSYESLVKGSTVIPFAESVYQKSSVYVDNIEEDLRERFVHAMTIACNGYQANSKIKSSQDVLRLTAKTAESLIFNLIFIRSCESRRVLPVHQDYVHVSLKALVDKVRHFSYQSEYDASAKLVKQSLKDIFKKIITDEGYDIYDYVQKLHQMVENGNNGFGVTGFVESVFYPDEKKFYTTNKINNSAMIRLIYQLFYCTVNSKNVQIPYNLITPRQLGSVYESFLEFQPSITSKELFYKKKKNKKGFFWQWVEESEVTQAEKYVLPRVPKNGIVFAPNNIERKTTGSYYTPDYLVDFVVKEAIGQRCKDLTESEMLKLKIVDPAMGSGHFLLSSLNFLSKKISEKNKSKDFYEIKRQVLDSCIFGSDINPSAVKLCKMSLWLSTAVSGKKLERLSDQIVNENSVHITTKKFIQEHEKFSGFDVVVGNPPWGAELDGDDVNDFMKQHPNSNTKISDSFKIFSFLAFDIIKKNGTVGFVIPNVFLNRDEFYDLRNLITSKGTSKILNLGDSIFENVTRGTGVFVTSTDGKIQDSIQGVNFASLEVKEIKKRILSNTIEYGDVGVLNDNGKTRFNFGGGDVDLCSKVMSSAGNVGKKFEDYFEFFSKGIELGCAEAFLVEPGKFKGKFVHPIVRGRDFSQNSSIKHSSDFICLDGVKESDIPASIRNHLLKFKKALSARKCVLEGKRKWFELNSSKPEKFFKGKRIIVRETGDSIIATKNKGFSTQDTVHNVKVFDGWEGYLDLFVLLLNSNFMTRLYRLGSQEEGAVFAKIKKVYLYRIPIPDIVKLNELYIINKDIELSLEIYWKDALESYEANKSAEIAS